MPMTQPAHDATSNEVETIAGFLESYVRDGVRPDEWLMQEWANRLRAAAATFPSATELSPDAKDAARYRWLKDAAGRTWEGLLGAQMTGQLDKVIDADMANERWKQETRT